MFIFERQVDQPGAHPSSKFEHPTLAAARDSISANILVGFDFHNKTGDFEHRAAGPVLTLSCSYFIIE